MYPRENLRQMVHLSGAVLPLIGLFAGSLFLKILVAVSLVSMVILSYCETRRIRIPIFDSILRELERPREVAEFPGRGAVFYFLGILLALMLFEDKIAYSAIIVTTVGDSASTMVGLNYGKNKLPYNREKSIEGTIAGFIAAFLALNLLLPPIYAALASFVGLLFESLPIPLDDNITIPLSVGILLTLVL